MSKSLNKKVSIPLPVNLYGGSKLLHGLIRLYYSVFLPQPEITGTFMEFGKFVWIHDQTWITKLHQSGSFGKGDLSRSDPTWLDRNIQQNKESLEEITVERRRRRRGRNQEVDNENILKPEQLLVLTNYSNVETFQLDLYEAFFLVYALNSLRIKSTNQVITMDPYFIYYILIKSFFRNYYLSMIVGQCSVNQTDYFM